MSAVAQKLNEYLKKQTQFSISFLQSKTTYVPFFKNSLNKEPVNPILELNEDNVSTFAKSEYERGSSKTGRVFEKTNTIFHFLFTK